MVACTEASLESPLPSICEKNIRSSNFEKQNPAIDPCDTGFGEDRGEFYLPTSKRRRWPYTMQSSNFSGTLRWVIRR